MPTPTIIEINISGGITIKTEDAALFAELEALLASGATVDELRGHATAWEKNKTPAGKPVASGPGSKKIAPEVKRKHDDTVQKSAVESKKIIETPAPSRLQLNHLVFQIPPEQINIQHEIKNVSIGVLRSSTTQKVRTGHGMIQVTIPLVFTNRAAVNSELVPLLHMLRRTPFCWTENEYLRKTLMPGNKTDAMMLTCASVTVQSVPNLPTTLNAVLQFVWFNYKPYINKIYYRKRFLMDEAAIPDLTGPEGFQPTPQRGLNINRYNYDLAYAGTVEGTFAPRGTLQEHIADTLKGRDESLDSTYTKSEQVLLYDQLQQKVNNPLQSESWNEFVKGYTHNQLERYEYGPSVVPDKYFRMMWKQFRGGPFGPPEGEGWIEEDPGYKVYSRLFQFNADPEFVPVHASVQFASRTANLPLLSQQMPTQQYLGPADRELTLTFNVTERGKGLLELFRGYIEAFENQAVNYRHIAQHQHMEIQTPFAKMAGFPKGEFGYMVVPEHIDIQTTPGNPGNSVVRVTFSEFNPSVWKKPFNVADREYSIFSAFIQALFNKLSGGRPRDIIYPFSAKIPEDLLAKTLGVLDLAAQELTELEAGIEIRMLLSKKEAEKRGQTVLFDCAQEILELTQARPTIFALATDKQVYGLKSIAEIDPYWSGDVKLYDELNSFTESMNHQIREVCRKWLQGDLAKVFPFLALEFSEVNHDTEACYPDMELPEHPATKRVVDTEADFYLVNSVLAQQADEKIQVFVRGDITRGMQNNVRQNKQTAIDEETDRKVEITEEEEHVYRQSGPTDMDNLPGIDKKWEIGGDLQSKENEVLPGKDGFVHNIVDEDIINAGINEIKHHAQLGLRKAFPTFRLYFLKEGKDQVDYTNFYEVQSGFAVKEIRLVRSRKIPADMCVIDMVNLDGFLETDYITDIRSKDLHTKQSRYQPEDRRLFFKHDDLIKSQLIIHNDMFDTKIRYNTVKKIMEGVFRDPQPGQYGPLGLTVRHGELADGKRYSPDQLADPVTNIRIATFLLCKAAFQNKELATQARFTEIVTSSFRFPEVSGQIDRAALQDIEKNGVVTDDWYIHVRNEEVAEFARGIREQESAEAAVRRRAQDERIEKGEEELENLEANAKAFGRITTGHERVAHRIKKEKYQKQIQEKREEVVQMKKDRENWVREPVGRGMIFREGTDIVLKLGYSNNPEKLETVFVGHVTESQPGPGTLQIVAQSFGTELVQEVKGVEDNDVIMRGASDPTKIANWIMSHPEMKHFGRWEDSLEIFEEQKNIRGVWYKKWNWSNNPSDDNIYVTDRDVEYMTQAKYNFILNGRTLWQGMLDLALMFPGYVTGVRPYQDLDKKGRRRWRNTLFLGSPAMTYLWRVPDNWDQVRDQLAKLRQVVDNAHAMNPEHHNWVTNFWYNVTGQSTLNREEELAIHKLKLLEKEAATMRREPFRRYHMLSSYTDIIDNGMILTKRDVSNGIHLRGYISPTSLVRAATSQQIERIQLDGMDDSHINWKYVENNNAYEERLKRMGTSYLMYALRDIYDGEITILGNPRIQPFDVCFLNDFYNDMSGPFEVEQVVHTFSEETGFITQLKPDLYTTIGETAQRTAVGAIGVYAYRTVLDVMGVSWQDGGNEIIASFMSGDFVRDFTKLGLLAALGRFTLAYPMFAAPVLLAGYFLGGYIRDHAVIRVVPMYHNGIPWVTGLEGFEAPETSDVLLNQFHLMRKGFSEGLDATAQLADDLLSWEKLGANSQRILGI